MKQALLDNLKNIPGWRTSEKLVVLVFDDYGNVRQNSAAWDSQHGWYILQAASLLMFCLINKAGAYDA